MREEIKDCFHLAFSILCEMWMPILLIIFSIAIFFFSDGSSTEKEPTVVYQQQPTVYVPIDEIDLYELPVFRNSKAKAYMDYKTITDTKSLQYFLINESDIISVSEKGFLKTDDGYVGVAMGSGFGDICNRFIVTLDTGTIKKLIKVEEKSDKDTDERNMYDKANGIFELVIDTEAEYMQKNIGENGKIFNGDFNNCDDFKGRIIKIERVVE